MKNGHDLDKVKDILKQIEALGGVYPLYYDIECMEEYKRALFDHSKFKISDRVQLTSQPDLGTGWVHLKDIMVKGAKGTVKAYDWYKGRFRYEINFDFDQDKHVYTINEDRLEKSVVSFLRGHNVIDAEKLNEFLKRILPSTESFDRNFIAHKIAQHEDEVLK